MANTNPLYFVDQNPRGPIRVLKPEYVKAVQQALMGQSPAPELQGKQIVVTILPGSRQNLVMGVLQVVPVGQPLPEGTSNGLQWFGAVGGNAPYPKIALTPVKAGAPLDLGLAALMTNNIGVVVSTDEEMIAGPKVTADSAIMLGYTPVQTSTASMTTMALWAGGAVAALALAAVLMGKKKRGYERNGEDDEQDPDDDVPEHMRGEDEGRDPYDHSEWNRAGREALFDVMDDD